MNLKSGAIPLSDHYKIIRNRTVSICKNLETEDYVIQPVVYVSPPKWHLGHTTWFFEHFVLSAFSNNYKAFNKDFSFVFNSYYDSVGERVLRPDRGNLSRPTVSQVMDYRKFVDDAMEEFLAGELTDEICNIVTLGFNHEEQHQELLCTDIKYILGHNPLFPEFITEDFSAPVKDSAEWIQGKAGVYRIGFEGNGFAFDNEKPAHNVFIEDFEIADFLVSNRDYLEFMNDGGYNNPLLWLDEGKWWVKENHIQAPMYWHKIDGQWMNYTFGGLKPVDPDEPVCHVSFYEAEAFARWSAARLPTEAEWEIVSSKLNIGRRWEWTNSAYLPYPGYKIPEGSIGEYNGKFMVNQMVLRGASVVTPPNHRRNSYRNFFHPQLQWQYTGIRLARQPMHF